MSTVCNICDYELNLTTRKPVSCPFCQFAACRTCCETYVLGETTSKCMNPPCNREWTRQFISKEFTAVFISKKLKKKREEILFDIERSLMPATQPRVERIIKSEKIGQETLGLYGKIAQLQNKIAELNNERHRLLYSNQAQTQNQRSEFIRACPDNDCRGFLSTQWKCGICEKWSCPDCHEIKGITRDAEHVCNPDTLATAQLLSNDTKPCPNCRTGIFKISGCDQMWCTQCHTAFNWRTGRIEQNVHNPHYYEWLRRNGNAVPRNPNDNPCHRDLDHRLFTRIRNLLTNRHQANPLSKKCEEDMEKLVRNTIHMNYVILPRYATQNRERRNEDLRIQYMRNQLAEDAFKTILQRNEKKCEKFREIHNIIDVLKTTVSDIILRFVEHLEQSRAGKWEDKILKEVEPIVEYANECLRDISKTYKSKCIVFSNDLQEN
jgi:hypothetical protein